MHNRKSYYYCLKKIKTIILKTQRSDLESVFRLRKITQLLLSINKTFHTFSTKKQDLLF